MWVGAPEGLVEQDEQDVDAYEYDKQVPVVQFRGWKGGVQSLASYCAQSQYAETQQRIA